MSTYKVVPETNSGFRIEINSGGVRQTMLGFDSQTDALSWIEADRARERIFSSISWDAAIDGQAAAD
jgi:hypothetical protein